MDIDESRITAIEVSLLEIKSNQEELLDFLKNARFGIIFLRFCLRVLVKVAITAAAIGTIWAMYTAFKEGKPPAIQLR